MSRLLKGQFPDRQFDVDFWQAQGDEAIFDAAWGLVELANEVKGWKLEVKLRFKELLALFNAHRVRYLIVGDYAVMKYTEPFYTKAMDIWIDATVETERPVCAALQGLGEPVARINVMTKLDAVTFEQAWENRVDTKRAGVPIFVIGLQELIHNKEASAREIDGLHLSNLRYGKQ